MIIETYGQLKQAIADWLNREDLNDQIPQFIQMFEARANRIIRAPDMVKRATAFTTDTFFVVPADWLETISFMSLDNSRVLEFVSVEHSMALRSLPQTEGRLRYYTHIDGKFFLIPGPGDKPVNLELIYRAKIPALKENDGTNWLLAKHPDLYLYGSLVAAEPYLKNDERLVTWRMLSDNAIAEIREAANRAEYPQGRLVMKSKTFG